VTVEKATNRDKVFISGPAPKRAESAGRSWPAALGEPFLVLLAACALISVITWPWAAHLGTAVSTHWDVGLHAWKLNWNARHILDGGFLLPGFHANFFYPQAYTLALDDLFWIPSYFAALVLGLSHNPILAYNATFMFFWALAGMFTFLLLRELALGRAAASLGGLAFCISPYLVSYYIEFNGVLCFGIPMVMWLLVRFLKKPSLLGGMWLALGFWAQAASALYYTAILALSLPLVALPLLRERAELLRSGSFWLAGAASLVLLTGLSWLFLNPYILLHNHMGLGRSLSEMALHSADALSYLRSCSAFVPATGLPWPGRHLNATMTEVILWPGMVVALLALVYCWRFRLVLFGPGAGQGEGEAPGRSWLPWLRIICLAVFWAWEVLATFTTTRVLGGPLGTLVLNLAILGILSASLLLSLLPRESGLRRRFVAGVATAAFLCFFISLGPKISVGNHQALASNWLVQFLSDIEVLHTTRVLSRYGIMVLFALVVAAAMAFDSLPLKRPLKYALWAVLLGVITLEANITFTSPYLPPTLYPDSKLEAFLRAREPCTLMVLPLGDRELDAQYMLQVAGSRPERYLINGWTGFRHAYSRTLGALFSSGQLARGFRELRRVWPDPLIVVDRAALGHYVARRGYKTSEQALLGHARLVYKDDRYLVLAPPPPRKPNTRYERWVRYDLLERTASIHFLAHSPGADPTDPVLLYVNDGVQARLTLRRNWKPYDIKISNPSLSIPYNAIALVSPPGHPTLMEVKDFRLVFR
jgi:hypothetical protein